MPDDAYRTIVAPLQHEGEKVKGSRFIAAVTPIRSPDELPPSLEAARRQFPAANHHVFAFRLDPLGGTFRYSDDGEPSGTAGKPILRQIEGRDLTDVLVVVSRIFGGTKLGAGGLMRAYGRAAAEALDRVKIRTVVVVRRVTLRFPYELTGPVQGLLAAAGVQPVDAGYGESVVMTLDIREREADAFLARLTEATASRASWECEDGSSG